MNKWTGESILVDENEPDQVVANIPIQIALPFPYPPRRTLSSAKLGHVAYFLPYVMMYAQKHFLALGLFLAAATYG